MRLRGRWDAPASAQTPSRPPAITYDDPATGTIATGDCRWIKTLALSDSTFAGSILILNGR